MAFTFGYSPWLLGLSLLLAGGLTYWTYRSTVPSVSSGWRVLLGGLRFTSLALICFLLLEPVFQTMQETERPPLLAVLVDDSRSMRVVGGPEADSSADGVRERLRSVLPPLQENLRGTARFFGFDRSAQRLPESPLDSLTFSGSRSDLGAALESVSKQLRGENLQAIALVSDGQYNSGQNPARVADRMRVPVHTVTVGDTARRRDLQVRQVVTNDVSYVDTDVPVRVTLGATDVPASTTTVTLLRDGTPLDTAEVSLSGGSSEPSVDLTFRPDTPGLKQLTVRAAPIPNEATTENNVRSVSLRVLENRRQVLVLGAAPSPNFAAARRVLERDANTNVTSRVPRMDGTFYEGPLPDTLSAFDALVFAGFPSAAVPTETVEALATRVRDGTPTLFLPDRQTDLSAWQEHFAEALPAAPEASTLRFAEAAFAPAESERSHPVYQIEDAAVDLFRRLPPISAPVPAWSPTPDARVLGHVTGSSFSGRAPALVVRRRAGHRTAAVLATNTWRWATLPADLSAADPLWPGLLSNLVRWISTDTDDRPVRVRPVTTAFEGDQPVEFTGQVYDESRSPVSDASVSVEITDSTGTEYPHSMEPLGNGRYELDVGTLPEGSYRYEATAQQGETMLGRDQGEFSVGALRIEYQQTRADAVVMRQIATRSGGTAYTAADADRLPDDLTASSSFQSTRSTESTEAELWRSSVFLAIILVLLGTEWALRKRFGLT